MATKEITIISKQDISRFWKKSTGECALPNEKEIRSFFPKTAYEEALNEDKNNLENIYITYLSGASINQQESILKKFFKFETKRIYGSKLNEQDLPGYYLVKLIDANNFNLLPEEQAFPEKWRIANIREATEILINIFLFEHRHAYVNYHHCCDGGKYISNDKKIRIEKNDLLTFSADGILKIESTNKEVLKTKLEEGIIDTNSILIRKNAF